MLAVRVRRAALVMVSLRAMGKYCIGKKASLFRRKTVVRRVSCDLQREAGTHMAREQAPLRWLSLGW